DVAVRVLLPAVALSVQLPTVAMPLPLVVWLPPVKLGRASGRVNVTATPPTGFPFASFTITDGGDVTAVPAVADWLVGLFAAIAAAAPTVPVAVNVTGLPVSDPDVAVRVLLPAVALSVQLPTVAMPLPLVVWLPPVTLPLPAAGVQIGGASSTEGGSLSGGTWSGPDASALPSA